MRVTRVGLSDDVRVSRAVDGNAKSQVAVSISLIRRRRIALRPKVGCVHQRGRPALARVELCDEDVRVLLRR